MIVVFRNNPDKIREFHVKLMSWFSIIEGTLRSCVRNFYDFHPWVQYKLKLTSLSDNHKSWPRANREFQEFHDMRSNCAHVEHVLEVCCELSLFSVNVIRDTLLPSNISPPVWRWHYATPDVMADNRQADRECPKCMTFVMTM